MDTESKFERAGRIFRETPPVDLLAAKEELDKVEPLDEPPTDEEVIVPTRWRVKGEGEEDLNLIEIDLPNPTLLDEEFSKGAIRVAGVKIGHVQKVVFESNINQVNKMVVTVVAMESKIRALGVVEIIDKGFVVDE